MYLLKNPNNRHTNYNHKTMTSHDISMTFAITQ
jgi:hypothetical protein